MKRFLSILLSLSMILGTFAVPVYARDNSKNKGKQFINSIQRSLDKAQEDVKKLMNDKLKLEATIQKEITKANLVKPAIDAVALKAKWQLEITKADAKDKTELTNFDADVAKYNAAFQAKVTALSTKLTTITTDFNKQISDLNIKYAATTDAIAKQNISIAITNITNYTNAEKAAINAYLVSLQTTYTSKQGIFTAQRNVLIARQVADMDYLKAMTVVKILELDNKLLTQTQPLPVNVEATIRAKYKMQTDLLAIRIASLNSLIDALKLNLSK